ncbi:MAG: polyprenyl synthetase family protein [Oligoflexia bacterium]|nr:polyprenyl synthetase family protein [Oligoflexia bacterium]
MQKDIASQIWDSVKKDLHLLDEDVIKNPPLHIPALSQVLNEVWRSGGKRLRPSLVFLCAQLLNVPAEKIKPYARASELVHTATLLHDDVIDQAKTRRGQPSVPQKYGNYRAVLSGDFLLAHVMWELSLLGHYVANSRLSETLQWLVEGEWLQHSIINKSDVTRELSLTIAERKTASLLMWCCEVPALIAASSPSVCDGLKEYGRNLGLAFQLQDDVLDYLNTDTGKPKLNDLSQGLMNSVSIELREGSVKAKDWIEKIFASEQNQRAPLIAEWVNFTYEIEEAKKIVQVRAQAYLSRAKESIRELSPNAYERLSQVADLLIKRVK